jgi:MFS family permease
LASILGPLAGGFIADHFTWRWVFYINIPFGLAAAVVVGIALVEPRREEKPVIDYAGAAWLTLSVTLLLFALVETGDLAFLATPLMLAVVAGVVVFGYLFVRAERRAVDPIVPFSLFRNRVVAVGSVTGFMIGASMFGALSFIPLFVQGAMGGTATEAGLLLTPFLLGWVVMAVVGGRLMLNIGYRPTVLAGLTVQVISFAFLSMFSSSTPRWELLADMALMGAGMGLVMFSLLITMQNSVGRSQLGIATSLNQFSRSIGQTVGVAVMGTVMTISLSAHLADIQRTSGLRAEEVAKVVHNSSELIDPISRAHLKPELLKAMQTALAGALHNVFLTGAAFAVMALLSGFWLPAERIEVETDAAREAETIPRTLAECERLLMAEMTTIDPDHEPDAIKASD